MKKLTADQIRSEFLRFFRERGHTVVPSSSLVPVDDPTLLFVNAGMVQFKDTFLGLEKRPYVRAVTSQKCVRAGGKHNDLENVGYTARHHTFFEMLGNFSFGEYFKREAIAYAWELLTDVYGLPADRLWATIYQDDDEAHGLWQEVVGLPAHRIVRLGAKDNFWAMGDTGPCGPCSEIIIDRGEHLACAGANCAIGQCDCDRWLEIWNLVFMQFDRDEDGTMTPLPRPSVDTGMGLERIASVLQGVDTNFDTDLFLSIIRAVEKISGGRYGPHGTVFPFRIIADHGRACTFMMADGVLPSNEGRGYVLRRILRRALRYGRELGITGPFLHRLVPVVVEGMAVAYPELRQQQELVVRAMRAEEERFLETLEQGLRVALDMVNRARAQGRQELDGYEAFMLYDTYGFPIDLAQDLAAEHGLGVDRAGFEVAMEEQRQRARAARRAGEEALHQAGAQLEAVPPTEFRGYETLELDTTVLALMSGSQRCSRLEEGQEGLAVVSHTPFYAMAGGQVADTGTWEWPGGRAQVLDVEASGGRYLHRVHVEAGTLTAGQPVRVVVDAGRRSAIARNHTATHLCHRALKDVLGEHANQAGSLVSPDRLRFDFTHFAGLTPEEKARVEDLVNDAILADLSVRARLMDMEAARQQGAIALFGEKYGDTVRVVEIGKVSRELCGGTHVSSTGQIGLCRIISESSIGAGLRRIEAVTGTGLLDHFRDVEGQLERVSATVKAGPGEIADRVADLARQLKETQRELEAVQDRLRVASAGELVARAQVMGTTSVVVSRVEAPDAESLRRLGDLVRERLKSGVVVLAAVSGDRVQLLAMATADAVKSGVHCGQVVKEAATVAGGGGGGRPDMAQAGGKNPAALEHALERAREVITLQLQSSGA
ncbi:MAG: alanine--tRNA ligase [Bacillota bacterium]